jgi:hypothetical protein
MGVGSQFLPILPAAFAPYFLAMSAVLLEIDRALTAYEAGHRARPVAVYLGERKFTQLTLDVAALGTLPALSTAAGRPLSYRNLDLLRDEVNVEEVRVI